MGSMSEEGYTSVEYAANYRKKADAEHIMEALKLCGGSKGAAADMLGIDRSTLWRKIKKYGIEEAKQD